MTVAECPPLETVAAWAEGELPEAETRSFEEHWFGCDRCLERGERMVALVRFLRERTPVFLTRERRVALENERLLPSATVAPGQKGLLEFGGRETGLWILRADLSGVARVDCEFVHEGTTLSSHPDIPFDVERGEVVIACRTHYQALAPARFTVRLFATTFGSRTPLSEYFLDHEFPPL